MSTSAATFSAAPASAPAASKSGTALTVGLVGTGLTAVGYLLDNHATVAASWLIGMTFWTGILLGSLFLIMIHHIFDAGWSVVIRRQYEHVVSAFPWLFVLFVPLLALAWTNPTLLWTWMDPNYNLHQMGGHGTVGEDVLWVKKSGFLNRNLFTIFTIGSFAVWTLISNLFRHFSRSQDKDGSAKWTSYSRKLSAAGLPIAAITLTGCIIFWVKSLEYHWFSTMYGVWFFAGCMRAALSLGVVIMVWLYHRGDFKGILNNNHLHSIGQLMLAFTVFWAYVTFSQYFLIWNANVPEETFWYNVREVNNSDGLFNQWGYVGMFLLFGHFFLPFLLLLQYPLKVKKEWINRIAWFVAFVFFIDLCYNVMPARKHENGDPYPFLQSGLLWNLTSLVGVGGIVIWAYLRSFATTKLIPIRDPRIVESLTYHEPSAL